MQVDSRECILLRCNGCQRPFDDEERYSRIEISPNTHLNMCHECRKKLAATVALPTGDKNA